MKYERKEALRYLRADPNDEAAGKLVDSVYLKLRNEVQPRHIIKKYDCAADEEGVTIDCGIRFTSGALGRHLVGCKQLLLLAATLGSRVDIAVRRLAVDSVAEAAAAQAVAAALIESYCDEIQEQADTGGLFQRPRFSPGYGDWELAEQQLLLSLLDCPKTIGLTLTECMMMAPSKSVTAVIGLSEKSTRLQNKCTACGSAGCPYRKEK